jgi:hypothetical protein
MILAIVMCLSLVACGGNDTDNSTPDVTSKTETSKNDDAQSVNKPKKYNEITINSDNWADYFEVKLVAKVNEDDSGKVETCFGEYRIVLKEEYQKKLSGAEIVFNWTCEGYGDCDFKHDLNTGAISYNGFKAASSASGLPTEGAFTYMYNKGNPYPYIKINLDGMATVTDTVIKKNGTVTWKGSIWEKVTITKAQGTLTLKIA